MSSPQPIRAYPRRSLAGPVVLIIVGVVFLLANMRLITWPSLGYWFAHYWPVLIIIWGVVKLLEYFRARQEGYTPSGIGAGGVCFLIFLVLFGLSATSAYRVNWGRVGSELDLDQDFVSLFGNSYSYSDTIEQAFTPGTALQVMSDHGDITVTAWEEPKIKVVVHKRVVAGSEDEAKKIDGQTKPVLTPGDKKLVLNANTNGAGDHPVASDLEIFIPRNAALDLATRHGDVVVRGRDGNLKIATSRGDVTLEDVKGDAAVTMRGGDIRAENVTGDVSLEGRVSDTSIRNVGGGLSLSGTFTGQMKLNSIAKSVRFNSERTDLRFGALNGEMSMDLGELRVSSFAGPFSVTTRSKDIHLDDVSGDVKIENTNGEVEVHANKLPLGNIEIDNRKGEIQVTVPPNAGFSIQAKTRRGDIDTSQLPGVRQTNEHGEATAEGTVGSGGPRLQINNEYGGITVRKSG